MLQGFLGAVGMQDLSPLCISRLLSAFTAFRCTPDGSTGSFVETVETCVQKEKFDAQSLTNVLWALSVSQVRDKRRENKYSNTFKRT